LRLVTESNRRTAKNMPKHAVAVNKTWAVRTRTPTNESAARCRVFHLLVSFPRARCFRNHAESRVWFAEHVAWEPRLEGLKVRRRAQASRAAINDQTGVTQGMLPEPLEVLIDLRVLVHPNPTRALSL